MGRNAKKDHIHTKINMKGTVVSEAPVFSNSFYEYLNTVREKQASILSPNKKSLLHYLSNKMTKTSLYLKPTDPENISNIIVSMKTKTSFGMTI